MANDLRDLALTFAAIIGALAFVGYVHLTNYTVWKSQHIGGTP